MIIQIETNQSIARDNRIRQGGTSSDVTHLSIYVVSTNAITQIKLTKWTNSKISGLLSPPDGATG